MTEQTQIKDRLVTIDEAVSRCKAAGFANINKRWWERQIERGVVGALDGVVPYLLSAEVDSVIADILKSDKT